MQPRMSAVSVPATAGNVVYSFTNTEDVPMQMLYGDLTLTTSASVANRQPKLGLCDSDGNTFMEVIGGASVTASLTTSLKYLPGIYRETAIALGALQVPIPTEAVIPPGWSVKITVTNGVAGDSYTGKFMLREYK